ncbi:MAG: hypothetical protein D6748_14690 [Calditrichaeota bacterium]|nr:MAG: hypothetical protein D6748_14690 [Calditrichota bacterium]
MKYKILIILILFSINLTMHSQVEIKEDSIKERKRIQVKWKTLEQYKQDKLEKDLYQNHDESSYNLRNEKINPDILETNQNFLSSFKKSQDKERFLKNINLTNLTYIDIAGEKGEVIILEPHDKITVFLSYYTSRGESLWTKKLDFSRKGTDLSRQLIFGEITNNGKYVAVYGLSDEVINLLYYFNDQGQSLRHPNGDMRLSPGKNYFYSKESLTLYDLNFSPIELPFNELYHFNKEKFDYRTDFQLLRDNIVLLFVTEYDKKDMAYHRINFKRKIIKSRMFIYDLKKGFLIKDVNMKIDEEHKYFLSNVSMGNDWLAFVLNNSVTHKSKGVVYNIKNSTSSFEEELNKVAKFLISRNSPHLFISKLLRRESVNGFYAFSILDLQTRQYFLENASLGENGGNIDSFYLTKNGTVILYNNPMASNIREVNLYTRNGSFLGKCYGWFNTPNGYGFLPIQTKGTPQTIDLLKINLEEM